MNTAFIPCPGCKRHILSSESACPFCQSRVPDHFGETRRAVAPPATGPLTRAAIVFMGAATTACSSSSSTAEPMPVVFYGPAIVDDASMVDDSGEPVPVVFYGPAIVDASFEMDSGEPGPAIDASADASVDADAGGPMDAAADADAGVPLPFYGPAIVDSGSQN